MYILKGDYMVEEKFLYFVIYSGCKLGITFDLFITGNERFIDLIVSISISRHGDKYLVSDSWRG